MDTVGNGSGTNNANGDYSLAEEQFLLKDSARDSVEIERMIVLIENVGAMDAAKYGNDITLTNGIILNLRDSGDVLLETYTAFPVKTNSEWAGQCHDMVLHTFGIGNEIITVRWTFSKAGQPITVDLGAGEYLEMLLNDDFSGLVKHQFLLQGTYRENL